MAILGAACVFIGLGAPLVSRVLDLAVGAWAGTGMASTPALDRIAPLVWVSATSTALLLAIALLGTHLVARARARATHTEVGTWDCGYAAPTVRMQYTSSSFAEMLVGLLAWTLRPRTHPPRLSGPFPAPAAFHSHVPDTVLDRAILPSVALIGRLLAWLRPIQNGKVHFYLLYILGMLVALLLWS
jgi:hypothetical protein